MFYSIVSAFPGHNIKDRGLSYTADTIWSLQPCMKFDTIDLTKIKFVVILSLPLQSTHKLYRLDETFVGLLKAYCNEEIGILLRHNNRNLRLSITLKYVGNILILWKPKLKQDPNPQQSPAVRTL
jgi:hypothetical protein